MSNGPLQPKPPHPNPSTAGSPGTMEGEGTRGRSPFCSFLGLSDWIFATTKQTHAIALQALAELIFRFLTEEMRIDPQLAAQTIWRDYQRVGRSDRPALSLEMSRR